MSSYKLRQELLNDPLGIGYSAMSDAAALASITDASLRPLQDRDSLSSAEIYNVIDRAEYIALSAAEKSELGIILGLGENVDVSASSKARSALAGMFGVATATRAELLALVMNLTQSRANELGIKPSLLTEGGVAATRLPDQP